MNLRNLQPGDLDRLYQLDTLCFEPPFRFSRAAMRRFAGAAHALVRLAVEPSEPVGMPLAPERLLGFAIVHLEREERRRITGYVVTLDVDPAWRGRGIATRLMTDLHTMAKAREAESMTLHVFTGNDAAIQLYERLGYRSVERAANFYGTGLDAFAYRLAFVLPG